MFGGEPFSGAGEAGLDFISAEEDAVFAAEVVEDAEIIARGNDEATFAENRLRNYGGHGFWRDDALESLFEVVRKALGGCAAFCAVGVGVRNAIDLAGEGREANFVGIR